MTGLLTLSLKYEQDVVTVIESGELTAKKIGASYRIKRSALDEYLAK